MKHVETTVRKERLHWFGHVQRMEDSTRAKQALLWISDEKNKRWSTTHYLARHRLERHRTDEHGMGKRLS